MEPAGSTKELEATPDFTMQGLMQHWPGDGAKLNNSSTLQSRRSKGALELGSAGLSRGEQGKDDLASRDFAYAGKLFTDQGDSIKANQLEEGQLVYNSKTLAVRQVAMALSQSYSMVHFQQHKQLHPLH